MFSNIAFLKSFNNIVANVNAEIHAYFNKDVLMYRCHDCKISF